MLEVISYLSIVIWDSERNVDGVKCRFLVAALLGMTVSSRA